MSDQEDKKNAELGAQIKAGLDDLHKKIGDLGKESSDVKAMADKLGESVKSFEAFKQSAEIKAKADAERIEVIEKHLAKSSAPGKVDSKSIKGMIHDAMKAAGRDEESAYTLATKTRTATDGAEGGSLITEALMMDMMLTYMADENPMFAEATVIRRPNTAAIRFPVRRLTFGAHAAGELQTARGKTKRKIEVKTIPLTRYYSEDDTTEELLTSQSIENESTIASDIVSDIGWTIQQDCLFGDGQSKPFGLLKEQFLLDTAFESAGQVGAPAKVTWTDLFNVQRQFSYERYRMRGKFYMAFDVLCDLLVEKDGEGRPLYLPGINGNSMSTVAGKQFVIMPGMDKLLAANTMPLLFGDMRAAYKILINGNYKVYRDETTGRQEGLISVGVSTFAGGSVHDEEAIRAVKGA